MQHLLTAVAISVFVAFGALTALSDDAKPDHITIDAPVAAATSNPATSG
jgi:hypothetical protein